jgi:hypothetical protein
MASPVNRDDVETEDKGPVAIALQGQGVHQLVTGDVARQMRHLQIKRQQGHRDGKYAVRQGEQPAEGVVPGRLRYRGGVRLAILVIFLRHGATIGVRVR